VASKTAILAVRVLSDTKDGVKGMKDMETASSSLNDTMGKMAVPAGAALAALTALGVKASGFASDLQQATGAVEAVFKGSADQVKGYADAAAGAVGLSAASYSQMAAVLGAQLKNMGQPAEQLAGQVNNLITLGSDLAATYGGTTADAVEALTSLLRGETDPIERFGVSIKQADINARAAALGLDTSTSAAEKNANATAALSLLYDQTADAQGQFAAQTDTLAEQQQIATAKWEDAMAALGEGLLPLFSMAADAAGSLADVIANNAEVFTTLGLVIAAVSAYVIAYNIAVRAIPAITAAATAAQWLWNAALTANPIGLVITAIGLLIAIIVVMVSHWDEVRVVFENVWNSIIDFWNGVILPAFDAAFGWLIDGIKSVIDWFNSLFGSASQATSAFSGNLTAGMAVEPWDGVTLPFNLTAAALSLPSGPAPFRSTRAAATATVINLNVSGAIDPNGTARTIQSTLRGYNQRTGVLNSGGRGSRPW